jgi:hypothetical protein
VYLELRKKANEETTFISRLAWFPKLKMKLKGRFETASYIRREPQVVLDSIEESGFRSAFGMWK